MDKLKELISKVEFPVHYNEQANEIQDKNNNTILILGLYYMIYHSTKYDGKEHKEFNKALGEKIAEFINGLKFPEFYCKNKDDKSINCMWQCDECKIPETKEKDFDWISFTEWAGENYIRLHKVWCAKYASQTNKENWKTTEKLIEIYKSLEIYNKEL